MTEQRDEWREILRRWGYYGIIIPGLDHGHSFQRMSEDTGVPARRLANWAANLPRLLAYEVPPPSVAEHLARPIRFALSCTISDELRARLENYLRGLHEADPKIPITPGAISTANAADWSRPRPERRHSTCPDCGLEHAGKC